MNLIPSKIKFHVSRAIKEFRPIIIWGPPGIGKSDIVWQIGQEQNRIVIDIRLLLMDPTDLKGIPFYNPKTKKMEWAPPSELPDDPNSTAIIFFDEMTYATPLTMGACLQLILNRKIGTYYLPKNAVMIAASNREEDRCNVNRMPLSLCNRFMHLNMIPDATEWIAWGKLSGIKSRYIKFIDKNKDYLFKFDPRSSDPAFPSPRTWSFASQMFDPSMTEEELLEMNASCVGDAGANHFMAFNKHCNLLPDSIDILNGDIKIIKDIDLSIMSQISKSLNSELNEMHSKKSIETWRIMASNYLKFIDTNFEPELSVYLIKEAIQKYGLPIDPEVEYWDQYIKKNKFLLR